MTRDQHRTCSCDVLVVGGGPAGSTIAALLAEKGWRVTLLEKAHHPRFHIGESLLPMNLPILERLGVLEAVRSIGMIKHAAEFVSDRHTGHQQVFRFSKALNNQYPYAFEVRRSEFDHVLLRNSVAKGVDVHEGVQVHDVNFQDAGPVTVHASRRDGTPCEWRAGYVVDASGRDTLISRKMGWKKKNSKHNSAAVFGHFDHVQRRGGEDEGNISIYWFKHGWFWMIPLRDGTMSVGAVCWPEYLRTRRTSLAGFFFETIALCPGVSGRMQDACLQGSVQATGNFSYTSKHLYRKRCLLVGDSGGFIDPVFSSGVFLAMNAACLGAAAVDGALRNPAAETALMRQYQKTVQRGLRTMSWFIYRFTSPVLQRMFMQPSNRFRMEQAVISMLSGDVFSKSPVRYSLAMFKCFYYLFVVSEWRRVLSAWRFRHRGMKQLFSQETLLKDPDV